MLEKFTKQDNIESARMPSSLQQILDTLPTYPDNKVSPFNLSTHLNNSGELEEVKLDSLSYSK